MNFLTKSKKQTESKIRHICSYWSGPDEVSGKESAGTAGYCLSEEQFSRLFSLRDSELTLLIQTACEALEKEKYPQHYMGGTNATCRKCEYNLGISKSISILKGLIE